MIRKAHCNDIKRIMEIVDDAKKTLMESGVDQWQNNYPNEEIVLNDIKNGNLYVCEKEDTIVGFSSLIEGEDETYLKIYDGRWLSDKPYITIHRIAVKKEYRRGNVATNIIEYAKKYAKENGCASIRVDTHKDNIAMNTFLKKNGFLRCGIIYLKSGDARVAYELVL